ncbi:MAG: bifunctional riboflavin kinase/FAD synthetase [Acidimicrobiales bacterium]|nr:MAG: bifunctional riboflavin kinase/FAD synthetase [Acidimicrobiales bacterium]
MEVIRDGDRRTRPERAAVVTIGAFDGVHLGHQALISRLREQARQGGLDSAVVTFDRHPATVVHPERAPLLLTDLDQKLELLAGQDLDRALVVTFDQGRSQESAEHFVADTLVERLRAGVVVVGQDFRFGHGRRGDVSMLAACGTQLGFAVEDIAPVRGPVPNSDGSFALSPGDPRGDVISSSRIRRLVADGQVGQAAQLLGRPHELRGVVARGDGRAGPLLGFPTANVEIPQAILLPADGVYAGTYQRPSGSVHRAAISIGCRPTFYGPSARSVLEVHVLDGFSADLYGEAARVRVMERLGDQQRFGAVEDLIVQIHKDVEAAQAALQGWRGC